LGCFTCFKHVLCGVHIFPEATNSLLKI